LRAETEAGEAIDKVSESLKGHALLRPPLLLEQIEGEQHGFPM